MLFAFFVQLHESSAECFITFGLACASRTHQHHSMSNIHCFIQLKYFVEEVRDHLERVESELVTNSFLKIRILILRNQYSREQILNDSHEQGQVLR